MLMAKQTKNNALKYLKRTTVNVGKINWLKVNKNDKTFSVKIIITYKNSL